jgi:hypothetical protein
MNTIGARDWFELSPEPPSLEAVRSLYAPLSHYRISPMRYAAGVSFPGASRAGRLYVLSGACSMSVGEWRASLKAGTFADFPAGQFKFEVLGDQEVSLVNVWLIPELYRDSSNA